MKKCVGMLVAGVIAFAAVGAARAGSGPATKPATAIIKGTAAPAPSNDIDVVTGACNVSAWVDVCPSGSCSCLEIQSPTIGASGKGKLTASNFFVTTDKGVNPATEPAVNGGPDPRCNFMTGVVDLADNQGGSFTINIIGTSCKHVIGISAKNPTGKHDQDLISGGWGISADPAPNPPESGWGTWTGSAKASTQAVLIHLSGWISH